MQVQKGNEKLRIAALYRFVYYLYISLYLIIIHNLNQNLILYIFFPYLKSLATNTNRSDIAFKV